MNDQFKIPFDPYQVIDRLRHAVDRLEAATRHVESATDRPPPSNGDLARAEAAEDLRELHDMVSRRLDAAIARLRTAVGDHRDA